MFSKLNDDCIFNILLNMDIDDIQNFCLVNKNHYDICYDEHFWKEKLKHDDLPKSLFVFDSLQEWVYEYIKIYTANIKIKNLLKMIEFEFEDYPKHEVDLYIRIDDFEHIESIIPWYICKIDDMMEKIKIDLEDMV